jgi:surfactin synthase thioesterase subunit
MRTESPWLLCRTRRPTAAVRLYCLPYSGGSAGEFLFWSDALPDFEVWGVQPPGRGSRIEDQPFTSMPDLVAALADEVKPEPPYVLFGHSLGAAVSYELVLALRARGLPLPERLYLSAHRAPHLTRPGGKLADLNDDALLAEIEDQNDPLPAELRDDPDWRELTLGGLRADLRIVDTYAPGQSDPLPGPVIVMGGTQDPTVSEADLRAWRPCTTGTFELRMFAGGHFYFREHLDDIHRQFTADLAGLAQ